MACNVLLEWEQQTLAGDCYFHRKDFKSACCCFERAAQALVPWLKLPQQMESSGVRCFVLACYNTAYSAMRSGQFHLAEHYYRYCLSQLEALLSRPECHRFRDIILVESEQAYRRYCKFLLEQSENNTVLKRKFDLSAKVKRLINAQKDRPSDSRASLLFY